jgi:hypothetical protein
MDPTMLAIIITASVLVLLVMVLASRYKTVAPD